MKIQNGLFIFHRDFRIIDNIGLIEASKKCDKLYTCFIFTPEQVSDVNKYKSDNAIQFMIESLVELNKDIHNHGGELMTFYGNQQTILKKLIKNLDINGVYFNKDYSPYSIERDEKTKELCESNDINCEMFSDYYLYEPGTIKSGKAAYKKYTPFYTNVLHKVVDEPRTAKINNFTKTTTKQDHHISLDQAFSRFTKNNPEILVHGGRSLGVQRLKTAIREQKKYDEKRDFFIENTTFLSAYIKFGCVSIREVYHAFKKTYGLGHGLIRELIWREFFAHVLYAYPEVVGKSYQPRYQHIQWHNSTANLKKWQNGLTGFPIIDASMRQLNTIGYMHNRGRMTVASFLIKTLLMDWRLGEKYFAQKLTDYDIASNNGNWQGISGTGVDMKPYFRDMNPWIQQEKFDKNAEFIKKWIPELKDVEPADIHKWNTTNSEQKYKGVKYPKPIVDYFEQKTKMLSMYKNAN
uniref:Photolyase/cryptochrome alpha/beta domain-containing protein n=1 Tax=viral metagenome TaxID=1070528 RepID=A0A6C0DB32_9ZZZZ